VKCCCCALEQEQVELTYRWLRMLGVLWNQSGDVVSGLATAPIIKKFGITFTNWSNLPSLVYVGAVLNLWGDWPLRINLPVRCALRAARCALCAVHCLRARTACCVLYRRT
jgi:hypothetical protein